MSKYRVLGSESIEQLNAAVEVYLGLGWSLVGGVTACRGSETGGGGSIGGIGLGGSVFQIWHAQAVTAPSDARDPADPEVLKKYVEDGQKAAEDTRKAALRAKLDAFHAQRAANPNGK